MHEIVKGDAAWISEGRYIIFISNRKKERVTAFRTDLEIEVCDALAVHVLDPEEDLLDEVGGLLLRETLLLGDEVEQLAATKAEKVKGQICRRLAKTLVKSNVICAH